MNKLLRQAITAFGQSYPNLEIQKITMLECSGSGKNKDYGLFEIVTVDDKKIECSITLNSVEFKED